MKKIVLLSFMFLLFSCNKNENIIKGDLYFKLVNFTPQEGMSEKQAIEIEKMLVDSKSIQNQNNDMKILVEYFEKLRKHNLLKAPYIKLMFDKDDVKTVFLSASEYQKIKKYTLESLNFKNKKLEVELKIVELEKDIYYSNEIINLSETTGKTYFEK